MDQGFSPNRFALNLLTGVVVVWVLVMGLLLALGARFDPPPGRMLVLFAAHQNPTQALSRVVRQDGLLIGGGLAGRLWSVYAPDPNFAARMRREGALALWRADAFDWMFSSGCTGASRALTRAKPRQLQ